MVFSQARAGRGFPKKIPVSCSHTQICKEHAYIQLYMYMYIYIHVYNIHKYTFINIHIWILCRERVSDTSNMPQDDLGTCLGFLVGGAGCRVPGGLNASAARKSYSQYFWIKHVGHTP